MHFLEWLDRHFASNCHYYYADDLGCPLDFLPDRSQPASSPQGQAGSVAPQTSAVDQTTPPTAWQ